MNDIFFEALSESMSKHDRLSPHDQLIDWSKITKILKDNKVRERISYEPLMMFKCLYLGRLHSLDFRELERSLFVRLDFRKFCGLGFDTEIPDHTTLWRFKEALDENNVYQEILDEINRQITTKGYKIENASCAITDATIIESAARPHNNNEWKGDSSVIYDSENPNAVEESKGQFDNRITDVHVPIKENNGRYDEESRWFKKDKEAYFGMKAHIRCDEDGLVDKLIIKPANEHESKFVDEMSDGLGKNCEFIADKGYTSNKNSEILDKKGLLDGIMLKAVRGSPLLRYQLDHNSYLSSKRYVIEQVNGILKRKYRNGRARCFKMARVFGDLAVSVMCHNIVRALNLSKIRSEKMA